MKLKRTIGSLSVVAVLCLGSGPVAHSADAIWPQFRGPNGNGIAEESGVPTEFGPRKNVLRKTPVPEGHSSLVIRDDQIFLTATKLHCLFAEYDSSQYRLVHTEKVGAESLLSAGVRLTAAVQADGNKSGSTAVIGKDLTVRAERITDWPEMIEQLAPLGNRDE